MTQFGPWWTLTYLCILVIWSWIISAQITTAFARRQAKRSKNLLSAVEKLKPVTESMAELAVLMKTAEPKNFKPSDN